MVDTEICPIDAELVGTDGDIYCIAQHLPGIEVTAGVIVAETEESERLHAR